MARRSSNYLDTIEYIGPRPKKAPKRPNFLGGWVVLLIAAAAVYYLGKPYFSYVQAQQSVPTSERADALIAELQPSAKIGERLAAAADADLALLVCAERHGRSERVAAGLAHGSGLRRGALAASVGHDHHNLMGLGADAASLLRAFERVAELDGGLVATDGERVLAELPLPLGGLLTDAHLSEVVAALDELDAAAASLGVTLPSPLMALSFLGLAVIPELKLTDHGLVDVVAGRIVPVPWGPAA